VTDNSEKWFPNRLTKNGVDFKLSVGAFDRGKMIGFTMAGAGEKNGVMCAFDAMTGIVKPHRGKGLARKMFEFMVPGLKKAGIREIWLEVLQNNKAAINAYQNAGFSIVREFDCYTIALNKLNLRMPGDKMIRIKVLEKMELGYYESFLDWQPSWENSFASIIRIPDETVLLEARDGESRAGLLAYYPTLNWIMCLAVDKPYRRKGIATALLHNLKKHIKDKISVIKMLNVDHADKGMHKFLLKSGFEHYVKQFEMKLNL
jgi:ribosomal protein S18 acetylase RimI-like enzyme